MEHQGNSKVPSSLLSGVLDHLGLANTSSIPETPAESLIAMLNDADWRTRAQAVSTLEEYPVTVPLESLVAALHDEDVSVRAAAVYALGRSKGQSALPYITEALRDSEWLVREAAVLMLGELGEQAPTGKLLASLDDENEFVREAASMMLQQNQIFRLDDPEDDAADDNVIITNLDTIPYTSRLRQRLSKVKPRRPAAATLSRSRQPLTFVWPQPRRMAAAILTGLVVIGLLASWLVLLPALRSSRSALGNLSPHPGTVLFSGQYPGGAYLPQWTPDGKHMAFVDDYGNMYVWDASTKKLNRTFTLSYIVNPDAPANWSWTSDGRHIVSADYTGKTIQLWDALTGQNIFSSGTQSYAWADDGIGIAIAGQGNTIHILNMDIGQELFTISSEHFKKLWAISWSPDRQRIATSSLDGTVEIWNASTGNRLQSFSDPGIAPQNAHNITSLFITWSPDSSRILTQRIETNGAYKSLQIWDATTGNKLFTFSGHTDFPVTAQWLSDGKRILSVSSKETLIWEAATGQITLRIPRNDPQAFDLPVLSPNEKLLAVTDGGPTIQIWDTGTGRKLFTYHGHTANVINAINSPAWSPNSSYISSADTDGNVMVWQAETGKLLFKYKLDFSLPSQFIPTHLAFLAWSPDGRMLAIASDNDTIAVLQAS